VTELGAAPEGDEAAASRPVGIPGEGGAMVTAEATEEGSAQLTLSSQPVAWSSLASLSVAASLAASPLSAMSSPPSALQLSLFDNSAGEAQAALAALGGGTPLSSRRARRVEPLAREARLPTDAQRRGAELSAAMRPHLPSGKGIALTVTENHYSMIAVRRRPDGYAVRVHRMFLGAEPRIVRALARYVVHNDLRSSRLLGEFIEAHQHVIAAKPARSRALALRTAGQFHDLQVIFNELNARFFAGSIDARITWGPAPRRRGPRRSIKMGSYAVEDRLIRIHPALDRADVPGFFVSWIVYHEMLHGKHDIVRQGNRRIFHSVAFLADERAYPDFAEASAWEKAHLDQLLASL